jgi:hypothetical protein
MAGVSAVLKVAEVFLDLEVVLMLGRVQLGHQVAA